LAVVPQLRAALDRHPDSAEVAVNCADCFFNLAFHDDNREPLMAVVPQLRAALDRHPDSAVLAVNCAGCFGNLAFHNDNRVALMAVVPQLRTALDRHPYNAEVVAKCAACFLNLAGHADNRMSLMAVVPQLRAALGRHADDEVAAKCAACFQSLSVKPDTKRVVSVPSDYYPPRGMYLAATPVAASGFSAAPVNEYVADILRMVPQAQVRAWMGLLGRFLMLSSLRRDAATTHLQLSPPSHFPSLSPSG
jgi:hypothetical protein